MSARPLSAVPATALSPRRLQEPVGVATELLPHPTGRQVMTSIDTRSPISESEISAIVVSLRGGTNLRATPERKRASRCSRYRPGDSVERTAGRLECLREQHIREVLGHVGELAECPG
jgi:hypothetical protein